MKVKLLKSNSILHELVTLKEIQERRSDPSFTDFSRYVADSHFILWSLRHLTHNTRILDIGAGAGVFSVLLKRLGLNVTATNLVAKTKQEKAFFRKFGIDFVPLNLEEQAIPFGDNYFDAILCMHVIEHLKKRDACFVELWRVLRTGGLLILATPNLIATILPRFIRRLNPFLNRKSPESHFKEYTLPELVSRLESLGFGIQRTEYANNMVTAGIGNHKAIRQVLNFGYRIGCRLIRALSYEIHIAAYKKGVSKSLRGSRKRNFTTYRRIQ